MLVRMTSLNSPSGAKESPSAVLHGLARDPVGVLSWATPPQTGEIALLFRVADYT